MLFVYNLLADWVMINEIIVLEIMINGIMVFNNICSFSVGVCGWGKLNIIMREKPKQASKNYKQYMMENFGGQWVK